MPHDRVVLSLEIAGLGERAGTVRPELLARLHDMLAESLNEAAVAPDRCEWFPTSEGVLLSIADSPVPIASTVLRCLHEQLDEHAARYAGSHVMTLTAALDHGFVTVTAGRPDGTAVRACTAMLGRADVSAAAAAVPSAGLVVVTSEGFMRDVLRQRHRGTGTAFYAPSGEASGADRVWVRVFGAPMPPVAPQVALPPAAPPVVPPPTVASAAAANGDRRRVPFTAAQARELIRRLDRQ
nr:hypothetical protein Ade03nite_61960 [Actinoplanes derwentensis]